MLPFLGDVALLGQAVVGDAFGPCPVAFVLGPLMILVLIRYQEHLSVVLLEHLGNAWGHWQAAFKFVPAASALVLRSAQKQFLRDCRAVVIASSVGQLLKERPLHGLGLFILPISSGLWSVLPRWIHDRLHHLFQIVFPVV